MINLFSTLGFGLFLGIKHAFDADHIIAVSTMLYEQKSAKKAAMIGAWWGIGHTATLFTVGLILLILRIKIPESISGRIEIIVGIMLVLLGVKTLISKKIIHQHQHPHDGQTHSHLHQSHQHQHKKSFLIGTVHGLAGSGALMILVLSLIKSIWEGIFYILIFGIGSTLGMMIMSFFLGIPISKTLNAFSKTEKILRISMGLISVIFGLSIIIETFIGA